MPVMRLILSRLVVAFGIIAPMVMIDDKSHRLVIGVLLLVVAMPIAAWFATHQTLKIGKESGEVRILADLLREHVRLKRDNPG